MKQSIATAVFYLIRLHDITNPKFPELFKIRFDYIIVLSVIELVGVDIYGDKIDPQGDRKAMENLSKMLGDNGYLLISVAIKNFRSHKGRGYTMREFLNLIKGIFFAVEITQRCGHICAVLVKYPLSSPNAEGKI